VDERDWHRARLIPTPGLDDPREQDRRATSALLAVVAAVGGLGRAVVQPLGAPAGPIETFVEVPFSGAPDSEEAPEPVVVDGLIRVRGRQTWTALVVVRTGPSGPDRAAVEAHLAVAREQGFDAVLVISNEICGPEAPPVPGIKLRHHSWSHLLVEAITQRERRGPAGGVDQAWVLRELVRYLGHPDSGALGFDGLGPFWSPVRTAVTAGVRPTDERAIPEVVARFDALLRFAALRLGHRLDVDVVPLPPVASPGEPTGAADTAGHVGGTPTPDRGPVTQGVLTGAIRIAGAAGPVVVTADLRSGRVTCHLDVDVPAGIPAVDSVDSVDLSDSVAWIVQRLRSAPADTRVEPRGVGPAGPAGPAGAAWPLSQLRDDASSPAGPPFPRAFRISLDHPMGTSPQRGRDGVVDSVLAAIDAFHDDVLPGLRGLDGPEAARPRVIDVRDGMVSAVVDDPVLLVDDPVLLVDDPVLLVDAPGSLVDSAEPPGAEPAVRTPPPLPSRRDVRMVRQLGGTGARAEDRPEPGWYQDPQDSSLLRWWDGQAWSGRTYPGQPALA
jgi:Protein of unknown function (DUF2510)